MPEQNRIYLQKKEITSTKSDNKKKNKQKLSSKEKNTVIYSIIMGVLLLTGIVLAVLYAIGIIRTQLVFVVFLVIIAINFGLTRRMNQENSKK